MAFSREFRILLAEILLLSFLSLPVLALADYEEDFEDDTPGAAPTEDWYTFSSQGSGSFAATTSVALNSISLRFSKTTATEVVATIDAGAKITKVCDEGTDNGANVKFAFNIVELPNAGVVQLGIYDAPLNAFATKAYLEISSTGQISAVARGDSGSEFSTAFTTTIAAGTWYNATLTMIPCSGAVLRAYLVNQDESVTVNAAGGFSQTSFHHFSVYSPTSSTTVNLRVDNLQFNNMQDPPPTAVDALVTVAVTGLVGLSTDRNTNTLILRHDSGDDISTYTANNLGFSATEETDCDREDAVLAQNTPSGPLVMYLDCDGPGDPDPDTWKIRTGALTVPDLNSCGEGCADIDVQQFDGVDDGSQIELAEVATFPIDLNVRQGPTFGGARSWKTAWAWSGTGDLAGEIGIAHYTNCQEPVGCPDDAQLNRKTFKASADEPEDICTGLHGNQVYMAVADTGAPTQVYPVTFFNESRVSTIGISDLRSVMGNPAVFSGSQGGAIGVACGQGRVGIVTATTISVVPRNGGAPLWTATCSCKERGVAMSFVRPTDNEQYVAWLDGTDYKLAYANNGTIVADGDFGTVADHTDMYLDQYAQYLIIGSNDLVALYDTFQVVGSIGSEGQPGSTTTTSGPGLLADAGLTLGTSLGVGEFGGNLLWGAILIAACAVGSATAFRNIRAVAAIAGAILGFIGAWALGFFSTAVVFSVVILLVVALILLRRGGGGD